MTLVSVAATLGYRNIVEKYLFHIPNDEREIITSTGYFGDQLDVLKVLKSQGVKLSKCGPHEQTFLAQAVRNGNYDVIKYLIENFNADVTERNNMAARFCESYRKIFLKLNSFWNHTELVSRISYLLPITWKNNANFTMLWVRVIYTTRLKDYVVKKRLCRKPLVICSQLIFLSSYD